MIFVNPNHPGPCNKSKQHWLYKFTVFLIISNIIHKNTPNLFGRKLNAVKQNGKWKLVNTAVLWWSISILISLWNTHRPSEQVLQMYSRWPKCCHNYRLFLKNDIFHALPVYTLHCTVMGSWSTHTMETNLYFIYLVIKFK